MKRIKKFNKNTTCCFCGHQILTHIEYYVAYSLLFQAVDAAVRAGYRTFLCDTRLGFGLTSALAVMLCQHDSLVPLRLIACPPRGLEVRQWPSYQQSRHAAVLQHASQVIRIGPTQDMDSILATGKWMVDHSSKCILFLDDQRKQSHTYQTFLYALIQKVDVSTNIYDQVQLEEDREISYVF